MADGAVLLVLATSTGGVGRHVRAITDQLVASGREVVVAGPQATDEMFGFAEAGGTFVPVEIASGMHPLEDAAALRALRPALSHAALVHAHGLRAGMVAALACRRGSMPLIVTWHNAVLASGVARRVYAVLERRVARSAIVTLCVSSDLVDRVRALGGHDVRLAPVGATPLGPPRRPRADVRHDLGADDLALVLAVGRLHPQKGFDVLIDAAARYGKGPDPALTVVAGEGPARTDLEHRIRETGALVRLLGARDDVADLLEAADLVVMPSRWEGSPLSAHEALLAGRPLVATAVGGLPEFLGGGAARLVPADDPAALAAAVTELLGDDAARLALAEAGRQRAADWPTAAVTVERVLDVYDELAQRP
jgi:glycosyltransferase involved in cell wall biosynthesis